MTTNPEKICQLSNMQQYINEFRECVRVAKEQYDCTNQNLLQRMQFEKLNNSDNINNINMNYRIHVNKINNLINTFVQKRDYFINFNDCDNLDLVINTIQNNKNTIQSMQTKIDDLNRQLAEFHVSSDTTTLCCVCLVEPRNYANIECGHICVCSNCVYKLDNKCPVCRQEGRYIKIISP